MDVYEELGVRKVINACGTWTHLGGSIPDSKVMDAMKEASQSFVIMMELMEKAGQIISKATGAEAGLVTSGSSSALVLGTAACLMRDSDLDRFDVQPVERLKLDREWRELIQNLPDTSLAKNEVIIQKCHRNLYDHAFKVAGGKLVEVGKIVGCTPMDIEAAINDRTIAIAFMARTENIGVSLKKIVEIAQRHDTPVIVDAAAELPPRYNLRKYIVEGADLVAFSGGKQIAGPNDTGILCGRRDLIKLATLQAVPYHGICRGMKVDRTQIVGMLTALRIWLEKDEEKEFEGWKDKAKWIAETLKGTLRVSNSEVIVDDRRRWVYAYITLKEDGVPMAADVVFNLRKGNPSIWVKYIDTNKIGIDTRPLRDGEEKIIVSTLMKMLVEKS